MATREIKTSLVLDGEKAFKASMDEAYRSMKVLGSELKLNTAEFGKNAESMEGLTQRSEILSKEVGQQKEIVDALTKAVEESANTYGEADKKTDAYRIKLNNAKTALAGMERDLDANEKAIDGFGKSTDASGDAVNELNSELEKGKKSIDDYGEKTEEAGKKTTTWGEALKKASGAITSGFSKAISTASVGIAAVASAAVNGARQLYDMAAQTAEAGDRVDKMSQTLGMSAKGFQEWDYILSQNGASIDSLKGSMTGLNNIVNSALTGNEQAAEKFKELGISISDLKNMSQEDVFEAVIAGLQNVSNESERSAMATGLLGGEAATLSALLNQSADSTEALRQRAHDLGIVMSDEAVAASASFNDALDDLNRAFTGVKQKIGAELLPGLTDVINGFSGMVIGAEGASETLKSGIMSLVKSVTSMLRDWLPDLLKIGVEILESLTEGILDAIPTLVAALPEIISNLIGFIIDNLPTIINAGVDIIVALAEGLIVALPQLIEAMPEIIATILDGLMEALPKIAEVGVNMVKGLWEGIKSMGQWIWDKLSGWAGDIIDGIAGFFGIRSPSTVMRDKIGKFLPAGIAEGIRQNAHLVNDAMKAMMPDAATIDATLRINRNIGQAMMPSNSVTAASQHTGGLDLSDSTIAKIVEGFRRAMEEMPESVMLWDQRMFARMVRQVIPT